MDWNYYLCGIQTVDANDWHASMNATNVHRTMDKDTLCTYLEKCSTMCVFVAFVTQTVRHLILFIKCIHSGLVNRSDNSYDPVVYCCRNDEIVRDTIIKWITPKWIEKHSHRHRYAFLSKRRRATATQMTLNFSIGSQLNWIEIQDHLYTILLN